MRPSSTEDQSPPTKRVARRRDILVETQPEAGGSGRVTRSRAASGGQKLQSQREPPLPKPVPKVARPSRPRTKHTAPKQPSPAIEVSSQDEREEMGRTEITRKETTRKPSNKKRTSNKDSHDEEHVEHETVRRLRSRNVERTTVASKKAARSRPRDSPASSSKVTLEQLEPLHDTSAVEPCVDTIPTSSSHSTADTHTRPATPVRRTGLRTSGTPRHVVEVVLNTPSRQLRAGSKSHTSSTTPSRTTPVPFTKIPRQGSATPAARRRRAAHAPQDTSTPVFVSDSDSDSEGEAGRDDFPDMPLSSAAITPSTSLPDEIPVACEERISTALPTRLHACLETQKRAVLRLLKDMPAIDESSIEDGTAEDTTSTLAFRQLCLLLNGTVDRGEGNSCFLTGPRGSGKTQLVEHAVSTLSDRPIVVRLSGHVQTNDRLAVREIARQLAEQTGKSLLPSEDAEAGVAEEEENPFLDTPPEDNVFALPPPAHLLALISMIPTLPRSTVIVIDAIDLFALHARQALLYCLFDTAQSCRAGTGTKGIAIVGVTSRIDTINMLEKRVKSRFSGRMLRTACPSSLAHWIEKAKAILCTRVKGLPKDWYSIWELSTDAFLQDDAVLDVLKETFALTKDVRVLNRLLISPLLSLKPSEPFLKGDALRISVAAQRCPTRFPFLSTLAYPSMCLLIAAMHARTAGHDIFTFEMLYESFRDQVRATQSAPVQVEGGGIGMVSCDREVLMGACEHLVSLRIFTAAAPTTIGTAKGFVRYRCTLDRKEVGDVIVSFLPPLTLGPLALARALAMAYSLVHLDPAIVLFVTLGIVLALLLANRLQARRSLPLPPGPRRLPLIGNYLDLPTVKPWLVYNKWARQYGNVIYMYLPMQPVVILNSARAAFDLMEKRSSNYSDKLFMTIDEMTGWDWNFSILPYGQRWRDRRRVFHHYFNQNAVAHYHPVQLRETRAFLQRLLVRNFSVESARLTTAAIIVGIVYGKQVKDLNDDYITLANRAFEAVIGARRPGAFWVDYLPFLRHIPSWVPGTASKAFAATHKPTILQLRDEAFYAVKRQYVKGTANPSIVQTILDNLYSQPASDLASLQERENVARDATSGAFLAAVDTSLIGTLVFVLAMAMHPDIQRKAQAQLDEVLSSSRLPTFEDYESLPYIHAIILEALRWMPPAPLGLPHRAMKTDEYNGYKIPEGALVFPNIWAMLHDPETYPDPETFNPDRFIKDGVLHAGTMDPSVIVFGFGRRICPGRFMGRETMFITAASILSVFDILPALGDDRKPVQLRAETTNGLLSYPANVPCVVRPRNAVAEQLIHEAL
ncbi:hypothetical protein NM688_g2361 [Phlebia brevispora]|uniref:Uncharacterized protein n=1 Tax=Phlebia brevispora TaxID=194682 RepID=A0ACC1T906_9APHY|nr:hypothetical protein NM688_g2361 [Phlebia brevispora]